MPKVEATTWDVTGKHENGYGDVVGAYLPQLLLNFNSIKLGCPSLWVSSPSEKNSCFRSLLYIYFFHWLQWRDIPMVSYYCEFTTDSIRYTQNQKLEKAAHVRGQDLVFLPCPKFSASNRNKSWFNEYGVGLGVQRPYYLLSCSEK